MAVLQKEWIMNDMGQTAEAVNPIKEGPRRTVADFSLMEAIGQELAAMIAHHNNASNMLRALYFSSPANRDEPVKQACDCGSILD